MRILVIEEDPQKVASDTGEAAQLSLTLVDPAAIAQQACGT